MANKVCKVCKKELSPRARKRLCKKHQSRYRYWGDKTWHQREARDEYLSEAHQLLAFVNRFPKPKEKRKAPPATRVRDTRATHAAKNIIAA